jgi:hypothetical protein
MTDRAELSPMSSDVAPFLIPGPAAPGGGVAETV